MRNCPDCNQPVEDQALYCDNCGYILQSASNLVQPAAQAPQAAYAAMGQPGNVQPGACSLCGYVNTPGEAFCGNCGMQLGAQPAGAGGPQVPSGVSPGGNVSPANSAPVGLCSACGYQNLAGETWCANCGVQLAPVASAPPPPPVQVPVRPPAVQPLSQPAPGSLTPGQCGECGYMNPPGGKFCQNCGGELVASPPVQVQQPQPWVQPQQSGWSGAPGGLVTGRLVVAASGANLIIPPGKSEVLIGRADPGAGLFPDIDLETHGGNTGGVSRRHARLVVQGGQVVIEDLGGINFTLVNKQRVQPGHRCPLKNGDEIRLGRVVLYYYG